MTRRAVLDACVLYPFSLRDTLLRLAERELYAPVWSLRILQEVSRNLVADGLVPPVKAERLLRLMQSAFEDAEVDAEEVAQLEPAMTNDVKDRHVLAAAVAGDAGLVVTANVVDFPASACEAVGVVAQHPDGFLQDLLREHADVVVAVLQEQAGDLRDPPWTVEELLGLPGEGSAGLRGSGAIAPASVRSSAQPRGYLATHPAAGEGSATRSDRPGAATGADPDARPGRAVLRSSSAGSSPTVRSQRRPTVKPQVGGYSPRSPQVRGTCATIPGVQADSSVPTR